MNEEIVMNDIVFKNKTVNDGISVVIPFYKNKTWLKAALKSIDDQTLLPNEIIIVNDGSNEDLSSLSSKVKHLRIINQENNGAASARNNGISNSNYKYIAFLDSDDYWHPQKLEVQSRIMRKENAMWSFHGYKKFVEEKEITDEQIKDDYDMKMIFPGVTNCCNIGTPCVMVDRKVFYDSKLKFNTSLKYGEDACLWFMLASLYPVAIIKGSFCFVRMHGNNAANNVLVQITARKDLWSYLCDNNLNNRIRPITQVAYLLCKSFSHVLESNVITYASSSLKETIAKVFYVLPWLMFKIDFLFVKPW